MEIEKCERRGTARASRGNNDYEGSPKFSLKSNSAKERTIRKHSSGKT